MGIVGVSVFVVAIVGLDEEVDDMRFLLFTMLDQPCSGDWKEVRGGVCGWVWEVAKRERAGEDKMLQCKCLEVKRVEVRITDERIKW